MALSERKRDVKEEIFDCDIKTKGNNKTSFKMCSRILPGIESKLVDGHEQEFITLWPPY